MRETARRSRDGFVLLKYDVQSVEHLPATAKGV